MLKKILLLAIWLVCWQATSAQQSKLDFARQLLSYDQKLPLDVKDVASFERGGVNVQDITFASPKGGRVSAYLVVPTASKSKHAGVVFGHWGNGNRTEFLPEALLLAEAGVVSVLIDYPWERTAPWWQGMPPLAEPEKRMECYVQALTDLRRAIDLLLARSDVDSKRIGYVGHSFGAQWGAILAAVDKRMKAAVLMAGVPTAAALWLESTGDASWVAFRKTIRPQIEKFVEVFAKLDAIDFVSSAAPVSLLFQFARQERIMTETDMQKYFQTASQPKAVKWYDAGHELQDFQAMIDRADWLQKQLGIRSVTKIMKRNFKI